MPRLFKIKVSASLQDDWLISRVLDFKEDLHREFLRGGQATVVDPSAVDRALVPLNIVVASKRALGSVFAFITKPIQRHDVAAAIRVSRVS